MTFCEGCKHSRIFQSFRYALECAIIPQPPHACCLYIVWFIKLTGYFRAGGTTATAEDLERMFFVMEQNGLLKPARILTGRFASYNLQFARIGNGHGHWQATFLVQKRSPSWQIP